MMVVVEDFLIVLVNASNGDGDIGQKRSRMQRSRLVFSASCEMERGESACGPTFIYFSYDLTAP